jgi:hypothetical protein
MLMDQVQAAVEKLATTKLQGYGVSALQFKDGRQYLGLSIPNERKKVRLDLVLTLLAEQDEVMKAIEMFFENWDQTFTIVE